MISIRISRVLAIKPMRSLVPITAGLCTSVSDQPSGMSDEKRRKVRRRDYRFAYPEFLPDCDRKYRNHTRELLERKDMLARREKVMIAEFYVGSVVAVTIANPPTQGPEKELRFVGIIIDRGGTGLRAWIIVRNVIDGLGVEFMYDLYSPTVKEIEVLRLEKRIDDELYYLRDCDPKHSTFPVDMQAELLADGQSVPVNEDVLPLRPFPWSRKWHRYADRLFGYSFDQDQVPHRLQKQYDAYSAYFNYGWQNEYLKYDLMREYFLTIPLEEQDVIWEEVAPALERRESMIKRIAARKALATSAKKAS